MYKDWHEMLPFALHGYRTTVHTSTRATPYLLVYGMEMVLPIEVEIPSLQVLMEAKLGEAEWMRTRFDQMNLIEEKRLIGQMYQQRMKKAFDKKDPSTGILGRRSGIEENPANPKRPQRKMDPRLRRAICG
ncbi:hypothetical protein CR513_21893, partial [Mucuna pruriens]